MIKLNNVKIGVIGAAGQQGRLYIEKIGKRNPMKLQGKEESSSSAKRKEKAKEQWEEN